MIAAGARSRRVVVRGGGEAATGRMLGVAASWACWRVAPTVWQSISETTITRYLNAAIGNGRVPVWDGLVGVGANVIKTWSGQDAS